MTRLGAAAVAAAALAATGTVAQERLKAVPGFARAQLIEHEGPTAVTGGALSVSWQADSTAFDYDRAARHFRYHLQTRRETEIVTPSDTGTTGEDIEPIERGRQVESAAAPDGTLKAFYRDRNVWIGAADGSLQRAVTTDGSVSGRVKYGTASWVYGEELSQRTAMWWSPDSRKLAYYRFDEQNVADYHTFLNQTERQETVETEAYPLAGAPNPIVDLYVYDTATKQSVRVDVRGGKAADNAAVGHYVYRVMWSPDGRELLFLRSNRTQNAMELAAANPSTGAVRVVVREEWPTGWLVSEPRLVFLADGRRFVWESQRNGWNNFYLYDLEGRLLAPLTSSTTFEAAALVKLDERAGAVFYTARDGDNSLKLQLHRVGFDGKGDRRLTDPAFHHTIPGCIPGLGARPEQPALPGHCPISPDSRYFVDVYQTHDTPPATRLADAASGTSLAEIARSSTRRFDELGLRKAELFTFTAADHRTELHGLLQFPSSFDPGRRYPVLVNVYGGPEFSIMTAAETFVTPNALTEYGFLLVNLDSRAVPGLGKRTLDTIYRKLGQAEIDDLAEGVKAIGRRPYVDPARVGIFGTSYGGYASAMALLRHPDVFAAAAASSPPTDWRNYDTVYTERYMGIPQDNKAGYDAGSATVHAKELRGRLLIYFGTADNNVHPSNSLQLVDALQNAGKSFDVQVGPDLRHGGVNPDRMMEFFIDALRPQSRPPDR